MYYEYKSEEIPSASLIDSWGGLNAGISIGENEWSQMKNLSSRRFPLACPREERKVLKEFGRKKIHLLTKNILEVRTTAELGKKILRPETNKKPTNPIKGDLHFTTQNDGRFKNLWQYTEVDYYQWKEKNYGTEFDSYEKDTVRLNFENGFADCDESESDLYMSNDKFSYYLFEHNGKNCLYVYSDEEPDKPFGYNGLMFWIRTISKTYQNDYLDRQVSTRTIISAYLTNFNQILNVENAFSNFVGKIFKKKPVYSQKWAELDDDSVTIIPDIKVYYKFTTTSGEVKEGEFSTLYGDPTGKIIIRGDPAPEDDVDRTSTSFEDGECPEYKNNHDEGSIWVYLYDNSYVPWRLYVYEKVNNKLAWKWLCTYPDRPATSTFISNLISNYTKYIENVNYYEDERNYSRVYPTGFACSDNWVIAYYNWQGQNKVGIANAALEETDPEQTDGFKGFVIDNQFSVKNSIDVEGLTAEDENIVSAYSEQLYSKTEEKKQIVLMGTKVCVFPEKFWFSSIPDESGNYEHGYMYHKSRPIWKDYKGNGKVIKITPCTRDGAEYDLQGSITSVSAPESPKDGQVWIDVSGKSPVFKVYSKSTRQWRSVATTYLKIYCKNAFKGFKQFDSISISGFSENSVYSVNGMTPHEYYTTQYDKWIEEYFKDNPKTTYSLNGFEFSEAGFTSAKDNRVYYYGHNGSAIYEGTSYVTNSQSADYGKVEYHDPVDNGSSAFRSAHKHFMRLMLKTHGNPYLRKKEGRDENIIEQINSLNKEGNIIYWCDDDSIVVAGLLNAVVTFRQTMLYTESKKIKSYGEFTFERKAPDLDYYFECDNRIWGCKYGLDESGKLINEIYACKQGDPTNWFCYMGYSTDSYTLSLGANGIFTGACNFNGYPTFFKDKAVFKIYGNYPANFQLVQSNIRGVGKGLYQSMVQLDNLLYYALPYGFVVYDGSRAYDISAKLGKLKIKKCVGGTDGRKIYFAVTDDKENHRLFVYDPNTQMWFEENCGDIILMANDGNILNAIERFYDEKHECDRFRLLSMNEDYNTFWQGDNYWAYHDKNTETYPASCDKGGVEWFAETGEIGYINHNGKYLQKISVRAKVEKGAKYDVYISYDGKEYELLKATNDKEAIHIRDYVFRIQRCDYFKLKFCGKGDVTLISLYKVFSEGSDKHI